MPKIDPRKYLIVPRKYPIVPHAHFFPRRRKQPFRTANLSKLRRSSVFTDIHGICRAVCALIVNMMLVCSFRKVKEQQKNNK